MIITNVALVLVGTTYESNITLSARAMASMGMRRMLLVEPVVQIPLGGSKIAPLLRTVSILDSLASAVADCNLVIGFVASTDDITSVQSLAQVAQLIPEASALGRVALVFGPELSDLKSEHLALCDYVARIDTDDEFASLDLVTAVGIVCYEIRRLTINS